jgi:hypothetical protein
VTPDIVDLARRAVACKAWRWLPGMVGWRTAHDGRQVRVRFVESVEDFELADPRVSVRKPSMTPIFAWGYGRQAGWHEVSTVLPDLTDPATLGCVLALLRQTWGDDVWVQRELDDEWDCYRISDGQFISYAGKTEAEAIVTALEDAP